MAECNHSIYIQHTRAATAAKIQGPRGNIPRVTSPGCKTTFIAMLPPCLTLAQFGQPGLRWCLWGCHALCDVQHFTQSSVMLMGKKGSRQPRGYLLVLTSRVLTSWC